MPSGSQFTKILVYAEKVASDLVKKYPTLTKVAILTTGPAGARVLAHYAITGTDAALQQAQNWLSSNNHDHNIH